MISALELPYRLLRSIESAFRWYMKRKAFIGSGVLLKESSLGYGARIGMLSTIVHSYIGNHARIGRFNIIQHSNIGNYSYTGDNTHIQHCEIGNYVSISWNVTIGPPEHKLDLFTSHTFPYDPEWGLAKNRVYDQFLKPCKIGHDVWIGANAVILRGVRIGNGAIIGAGAVVTRDIPDYAIVVGVPARIIRYRFPPEVQDLLNKTKWWDHDPKEALAIIEDVLPGLK